MPSQTQSDERAIPAIRRRLNHHSSCIATGNTQLFEYPSSGITQGGHRAALVVTDGNSNVNKSQTIPQANLLKATGVEVFVLAVGSYSSARIQEMRDICSPPYQDHLFRVSDSQVLC